MKVDGVKLAKYGKSSTCPCLKRSRGESANANKLLIGWVDWVTATKVNVDRMKAIMVDYNEFFMCWFCHGTAQSVWMSKLVP